MAGRQEGERRGVHHAQAVHADHAGLGVDHRRRVARLAHGAGAGRVEDGGEALADEGEDLVVGAHGRAGEVFRPDQDGRHGLGGEELPDALVAGDGDGDVGRVGEPVGVDDGRVGGVGGGDVDGSARQRGDQRQRDGGVLVPVGGRVADEVSLVAEIGADVQVFDFGPVGGEGVEVGARAVREGCSFAFGDFFPCLTPGRKRHLS